MAKWGTVKVENIGIPDTPPPLKNTPKNPQKPRTETKGRGCSMVIIDQYPTSQIQCPSPPGLTQTPNPGCNVYIVLGEQNWTECSLRLGSDKQLGNEITSEVKINLEVGATGPP